MMRSENGMRCGDRMKGKAAGTVRDDKLGLCKSCRWWVFLTPARKSRAALLL